MSGVAADLGVSWVDRTFYTSQLTFIQPKILLQRSVRRIVLGRLDHFVYTMSYSSTRSWSTKLTDSDASAQPLERIVAPRQLEHPMEDISPDALEPIVTEVLLRILRHLQGVSASAGLVSLAGGPT
jgi:hypothetical protein